MADQASYDQVCALRFNVAGAKPDGSIGEDHGPETHLLPPSCKWPKANARRSLFFGDDYQTPDGTNVRLRPSI